MSFLCELINNLLVHVQFLTYQTNIQPRLYHPLLNLLEHSFVSFNHRLIIHSSLSLGPLYIVAKLICRIFQVFFCHPILNLETCRELISVSLAPNQDLYH